MTRKYSNTHVDVIRLTLDKVADADVIEVLQAAPFGSKSRMVTQAIRMSCRVVGDAVVIGAQDQKEVCATATQSQPAPVPITVEVDTF